MGDYWVIKDVTICFLLLLATFEAVQHGQHQAPTDYYSSSSNRTTRLSAKSITPKIVGGHVTLISQNPWQAQIYVNDKFHCGGSLIHTGKYNSGTDIILTAAHCLDNVHPGRLSVQVGFDELYSYWAARLTVRRFIKHSSYKRNEAESNDIALIQLQHPVRYGQSRPVALAQFTSPPDPQNCKASGYGDRYEGARKESRFLREAFLPMYSKRTCHRVYPKDYVLRGQSFCAGFLNGGRDTCQGDSGGPYVCMHADGKYRQYGIVSSGQGCARRHYLGLYASVPYYYNWILFNIDRLHSTY